MRPRVRAGVACWWAALLLLGLPAPGPARAAVDAPADPFVGTLFVTGEDGVRRPAVALATDVEIRVSGLVARVRVSQQFSNQSDLWVEGTYVFPLPEMAAVDRMRLDVGDRRIEGRIQERARARQTYERARAQGRAASLLEQERPNLFTTSVANIGPGEPVRVQIEYQHTLRYEAGVFELRFPMTLTARYVPGGDEATGAPPLRASQQGTGWSPPTPLVPDAPRITPWMLHPDSPVKNPLSLHVEIDVGTPLAWIASPSHPVDTDALGSHRYQAWLRDVPADRDFVLRFAPRPQHEPRAALFSEEYAGDQYALLMLLPPDDESSAPRIPREAIFVIDTSGSMAGASIGQARAALHLALDHLAPGDRFNVISFDDAPTRLFETSQPVGEASLRRAHRFVERLRASGGTEMLAALEQALSDDGDPDVGLRQVVFVTDGSIGNESQLFAAIRRGIGRSRLFTVGIGSAPNAYFLNRAALFGRGTATAIGSHSEVQERMEALFRKIESPALTDIEVHWNDEVEMWPARVPDLYAGEPVFVTARLQRFVGDVRISGRRGERPFEVSLPLAPGAPGRGIHKLWARAEIAHWMGQESDGVDPAQVRNEILAVALEHELVSRFTSLVAVDVTPRRPASAPGVGSNVPNLGPAGFDPALVPGVLPQGATPAPALIWLGSSALLASAVLRRAGRRRA